MSSSSIETPPIADHRGSEETAGMSASKMSVHLSAKYKALGCAERNVYENRYKAKMNEWRDAKKEKALTQAAVKKPVGGGWACYLAAHAGSEVTAGMSAAQRAVCLSPKYKALTAAERQPYEEKYQAKMDEWRASVPPAISTRTITRPSKRPAPRSASKGVP